MIYHFHWDKKVSIEDGGEMKIMHSYPIRTSSPNQVLPRREVNVITISGEGRVSVEPNLAYITVGVETESKNLQEAQGENSQTSANVLEAIFNLQVPRENVRTIEYRINNVYDFVDGKQIFRGYEVRHLLEVKVEDISKVGEVVDAAVAAGANVIYNVRFDISNRSEWYNEALVLALREAQSKARTLAGAMGVNWNPVPFEITEAKGGAVPVPFQTFEATKVAGVSTPIEPGQLRIEALIIAKFAY